ncbi:MAG: hypothetical protein J5617_03875 [Bacilli bacterium]|nr:hypothetical protein [Bacilli bacterium]
MIIKCLYNSYNLASQISRNAADHVLEFNKKIEEVPKYSKDAPARIMALYEQCRWYMIGLYEASHTMLFSIIVKVIDADRKRVETYIEELGKETDNG